MVRENLQSWGLRKTESEVLHIADRFSLLPNHVSMLPFGKGRSYGDSCLNPGGAALLTSRLDHFISFDADSGILACEAGVTFDDILKLTVPKGWFLPVTPGTRFITLGGAIANDVHGKNHHAAGSFGCHLRRFELLRTDGQRLLCTREDNAGWFAATIGGLGLTGLIVWAEFQLRKIAGPWVNAEAQAFSSLEEFSRLSAQEGEYTVAWLDCTRGRVAKGSGIFLRGDHAADSSVSTYKQPGLSVPLTPPFSVVNSVTTSAMNAFYRRENKGRKYQHYLPFFYPLDGIGGWNRLYGRDGFYQYQCLIPAAAGLAPLQEILQEADRRGIYSFLSTLKVFGHKISPGMLSFPAAGVTFAIDVIHRGKETLDFLTRLDAIVSTAGGRIYPAKDARMPGRLFRQGYPRWQEFSSYLDPHFSSGFWRRIMEDA